MHSLLILAITVYLICAVVEFLRRRYTTGIPFKQPGQLQIGDTHISISEDDLKIFRVGDTIRYLSPEGMEVMEITGIKDNTVYGKFPISYCIQRSLFWPYYCFTKDFTQHVIR